MAEYVQINILDMLEIHLPLYNNNLHYLVEVTEI